jgi:hypothetical protein
MVPNRRNIEEMRKIGALNTGIAAFDFSNVDDQPNFSSFGPPVDFNAQE